MKNKISISILSRWVFAPLLVASLIAWGVSPAYPGNTSTMSASRVASTQTASAGPTKDDANTLADIQEIKDRIKELEAKERQNYALALEGQRKTMDWWFSFLAVLTAIMAIFGGLIPFLMARKDKELIEQDKEQIKQRLAEIEGMRVDAASHVEKIHQDVADVAKAKEELQAYQSGAQVTANKDKIQQAIISVQKDKTEDTELGLRAAAVAASEAEEAEKAYALWNALTQLNKVDESAQFNAGYWAQKLGDGSLGVEKQRWLKLAGQHYLQTLVIKPDDLKAANNLGNVLAAEAEALAASDPTAAHILWQQAGEKYQLALRIEPDKYEVAYNWGNALDDEAKVLFTSNLHAASALWQQAGEKFQLALSIKSDMHEAAFNWGSTLGAEAQSLIATDPRTARALWQQAGEKFQLALSIKSDMHEAAFNWGNALGAEAQALFATDPRTARALWQQAGEKFQLALSIKSDNHDAANNWGNALGAEAQALFATDPATARTLWQQAGEKFQLALRIKPDMHDAANNWVGALLHEANAIADSDAGRSRALLIQAEQLLLAHADVAPGKVSYNLACVYGQRGDVAQCLQWLKVCQTHENLLDCEHVRKDKDLDAVRGAPEFIAWLELVCNES